MNVFSCRKCRNGWRTHPREACFPGRSKQKQQRRVPRLRSRVVCFLEFKYGVWDGAFDSADGQGSGGALDLIKAVHFDLLAAYLGSGPHTAQLTAYLGSGPDIAQQRHRPTGGESDLEREHARIVQLVAPYATSVPEIAYLARRQDAYLDLADDLQPSLPGVQDLAAAQPTSGRHGI
eukprot:1625815-Rhodomonas_salina.1